MRLTALGLVAPGVMGLTLMALFAYHDLRHPMPAVAMQAEPVSAPADCAMQAHPSARVPDRQNP